MITQTLAIFHDAYRELNAKKMFWIVLILSGLVVAAFAAVGVNDNKDLTFFGSRTPIPMPFERADFYRFLFTTFGIGTWLTLAATILALISTASIFPDLTSGGSIDLYLCKPIGRLRLFVTKYATGLLFVALQVLVFSLASFLVIGLRGGAWEPRVFLAVPLVVCFFSYLFCVSALVGVLTRSTTAAILLTVLAWFIMFIVGVSEVGVLHFKTMAQREAKQVEPQIKVIEGQIAFIEKQPPDRQAASAETLTHLRAQRDELRGRSGDGGGVRKLEIAHDILYGVKTVLPKTSETTDLMSRWLLSDAALNADFDDDEGDSDDGAAAGRPGQNPARAQRRAGREDDARTVAQTLNTRPVSWVIGTSLGFEAVVLALAAWVFWRRDY